MSTATMDMEVKEYRVRHQRS